MTDDYPHAGSYLDRHGKRRWRFRHAGKTIQLPGLPGQPEFEAAYAAALEGRRKTEVHRLPTATAPKSLRAAWRILTCDTPEWKALDPETQHTQTLIAERFLRSQSSRVNRSHLEMLQSPIYSADISRPFSLHVPILRTRLITF
jgi:hypothetical protein